MQANQDKSKSKMKTVRSCEASELPEVIISFSRAGYALAYHPCCQGFSSNYRSDLLKHQATYRWGKYKASLGLRQVFSSAEVCKALGFSEERRIRFNKRCLLAQRSSSEQSSRGRPLLTRRDQPESNRQSHLTRRDQPESSRQSPLLDPRRTAFPGRAAALAEGIERTILQLKQEIEQLKARVNKLERTVQVKQEEGQEEINKESHNRQNRPSSSQRHRSIVERSDITVESTALERARCLILLQEAQRRNEAAQTQRNESRSPELARTQLQAAQRPNGAAQTQRNEITDESGSPKLARIQLQVAKGSPRLSRPRRTRLGARSQTSQGRQNWPGPNSR